MKDLFEFSHRFLQISGKVLKTNNRFKASNVHVASLQSPVILLLIVDWRRQVKQHVYRAPWRKCRRVVVCVDLPSTTMLTPTVSRSHSADIVTALTTGRQTGLTTSTRLRQYQMMGRQGAMLCRHPYWRTASRKKWNSASTSATTTDWNGHSTSISRCRKLCYSGFVVAFFLLLQSDILYSLQFSSAFPNTFNAPSKLFAR